ncbi:MAG TPA: ABC transporter ATP-binding protein [Acidobacteriota bacterium]|nr:ABC transporter ATP-binding protein [Acidobacteriota bacterium]
MRIERLVKQYPLDWRGRTVRALDEVSFVVRPGTICALVGANGSGKSTTLKLCAGLGRPTSGVCVVAGRAPVDALREGQVGYLPEETLLPEFDDAREFLGRLAALGGLAPAEAAKAVEEALAQTGLAEIATQPLGALSKGQRQRVGLAQALLRRPDVLLLDEPAAGLDPRGQAALRELMAAQRSAGRTVVFSAHFLPHLDELCDQVVVLERGRVLFDGNRAAVVAGGGLERIFLEATAL